MNKYILPFFLIVAFAGYVSSQVRFSASAERSQISMGEQAVVTATLITSNKTAAPSIPPVSSSDAFSVSRTDQRQSSSSSIQIINGRASQKTEVFYQFYYYISPLKTGDFTFPSLEITVDGKQYRTEPIQFKVQSESVTNPDIKVMLQLNKRSLFVGEQSIFTFKVAQKAQSSTEVRNGFMPALEKLEKAFGSDFSLSRLFTNQISTTQENISGELYNVYSLRYALYPVNSGTFTIQPIPFGYQELRRVRSRRGDPFFDDFFDMNSFFGSGVQAIDKNAISNSLSIQVKPIPTPPAKFGGSVGKFTLSASVSPTEIPAGEAITLKVSLKGNTRAANVGDIVLPAIENCEVFKPEQQMVTDTGANGLSTRKNYKYLLIPKQQGTLVIPPISLPYFDPETATFKTASSDTLKINVTKGKDNSIQQNRYLTQEEIREIGKDIRYIKTGIKIKNQPERPYHQAVFYFLFPVPFVIFAVLFLYRVQSKRQQMNFNKQIKRKALSLAQKKLNTLKKQSKDLSSSQFLGKIADTIEQFISEKFGFPATGRTLDELKTELLSQNADEKTVADLTAFIEHLDGYRFGGLTLDEASRVSVLDKASVFVYNLEKSVRKGSATMHRSLTVMIGILLLAGTAKSAPVDEWFDKANQYYINEQFDSATVYYEKIVESGISNYAVFYNLGNTCFRLKKLGLARLYYEKAAKLNPKDADISANIRYIKANIVDKVPEQELGFLENIFWQLHIAFPLTSQLWILCTLLFIISILLSTCLFISGNSRLWVLYLTVLLFLVLSLTGFSAGYKIYELEKVNYAILLSTSSDARNEPKGGKILFTAHEGTKFRIRKTSGSWSLVSLPNGVSGWIESKVLGKI